MKTHIGQIIEKNPKRAHEKLQNLFRKHGTRKAVALAEGVPESTVRRWIEQLKSAGVGDPRVNQEGELVAARGPRPQKSNLLERCATEPAKVKRELTELLKPRAGEQAKQARVRTAEMLGVSEITIRRALNRLGIR